MIGYVLARRYAKAAIDLAQGKGIVAEVGHDLSRIAGLFDRSHELAHVFADPTVSATAKENLLKEIMAKGALQDLTTRFVHILLTKGRILGIGEIASAYQDLADERSNRVRARVVVASSLTSDEEDKLRDKLSRISGKEVVLDTKIDESILGGVVAYMGSHVYDGSLKGQLLRIRERLHKGR